MMSKHDREAKGAAWLQRLQEVAASKESLAEYTRRHGLKLSEAYRWTQNLRRTGHWPVRRRFCVQRYASLSFNPCRRVYSASDSFEAATSCNRCSHAAPFASRSCLLIMPPSSVLNRRHLYQAIPAQGR